MTSSTPTIAKPRTAMSAQALGVFLALLGAALFATKGIVVKLAIADGIDPLTTLAWRMIVSVPIFVTVGIIGYRRQQRAHVATGAAHPLDRRTLFQALGVGLLGYYIASFLDFSALTYISAQLDRLILLTYPFFVVLFGVLLFGRKVTPVMLVSLAVSYGGILVIFARDFSVEGGDVVLGSALVFGSSVAYAGYWFLKDIQAIHDGGGLARSSAGTPSNARARGLEAARRGDGHLRGRLIGSGPPSELNRDQVARLSACSVRKPLALSRNTSLSAHGVPLAWRGRPMSKKRELRETYGGNPEEAERPSKGADPFEGPGRRGGRQAAVA